MSATIWKFPLPIGGSVRVAMPDGARVLAVAAPGRTEQPCVWAIVHPDAELVDRVFEVRGTGHPLGEVGDYVGTFTLMQGSLVFHVFEEMP